MSTFKKVNLRELDDAMNGAVEGLTGRFARKALEARDVGVSLFSYAPGFTAGAAHRHKVQEEAYVVISGSGEALIDGESIALGPFDVLRVAPEAVRAFNAGPDGLELICVGGPRPEEGDGELVRPDWIG